MKETTKLSVGPGGQLNAKKTIKPEIGSSIKELDFIPFRGTILVKQLPATETVLDNGLVIPFSEENRGVVIGVGSGVEDFEVGDVVCINLGHGNIMIHCICGEYVAPLYPSSIIGKYKGIKFPIKND